MAGRFGFCCCVVVLRPCCGEERWTLVWALSFVGYGCSASGLRCVEVCDADASKCRFIVHRTWPCSDVFMAYLRSCRFFATKMLR